MIFKKMQCNLSVFHYFLPCFCFLTFCWMCVGCPYGDCYSAVEITVKIDQGILFEPGDPICVVIASDIEGGGWQVDEQGVPSHGSHMVSMTMKTQQGVLQYHDISHEEPPYDTWIFAFIDTNGNEVLDDGEAFGIDPNNPIELGCSDSGPCCEDYSGVVMIDQLYEGQDEEMLE